MDIFFKSFFSIYWDDLRWLSSQHLLTWFKLIEFLKLTYLCSSRMKATGPWAVPPLMCCWILFDNTLFDFCIDINKWTGQVWQENKFWCTGRNSCSWKPISGDAGHLADGSGVGQLCGSLPKELMRRWGSSKAVRKALKKNSAYFIHVS